MAAELLASGERPEPMSAPPELESPPLTDAEKDDPVHPYVRVRDDGTIIVYSSQTEMGQGVFTGLATIVAEEMDTIDVSATGTVVLEHASEGRQSKTTVRTRNRYVSVLTISDRRSRASRLS